MRKAMRIIPAAFISICLICPTVEALSISITNPSGENTGEVIIAPKRDFYVAGAISRDTGDPASFDIRVEVFSGAACVRRIQSIGIDDNGLTGRDYVSYDYAERASWSTDSLDVLMANPPADLVYNPSSEDSFKDQRIKLAIAKDTKTSKDIYTALVFGGYTKNFDVDTSTLSGDIDTGTYRIVASAISRDNTTVMASADLELKVGIASDRILSRFSKENGHLDSVYAFADNKYRIYYNDYFPGNGWNYSSGSYEIPRRWRPNDSHEYDEGNVHIVLYNIDNVRCAAQKVEIGYLLKHKSTEWATSNRFKLYRYDIGEPSVAYSGETKHGKIVEFDKKSFFEPARIEFREEGVPTSDNVYYSYKDDKTVLFDLSGKLKVPMRVTTSIFGVTRPIPCDVEAGTGRDNTGNYNVKDLIDTIRYELKNGEKIIMSCDRKIGLERWYSSADKWATYPSIYEYKHDFVFSDELRGKTLTLEMYAYTSLDKSKEVDSKSCTLQVGGEELSSSGGCNAGWALLLIFAAIPFIIRSKEG